MLQKNPNELFNQPNNKKFLEKSIEATYAFMYDNLRFGLPKWHSSEESTCQCKRCRDMGSIPGLARSPGVGNGNLLLYFCLKNSIDREAWWATIHGIAELGMTEAPPPLKFVFSLFSSPMKRRTAIRFPMLSKCLT